MEPSYEELKEQLNRSRRLCDAALTNERVWETTMMQACGEDGPKSVADKFAELEARCAALAAENAGLNDKMDKLATWPGIEFYSSAWEFNNGDGNAALEFMCDVQTPATDAFLAEVRAQGVEMCSAEIQKQTWDEREGDGMVAAIDAMEIYAALLRKGVQS
ncbi:hypothetical protein [Escherichia coli]|uniref:hypothetical protein n=1 Tax=Escherichia coli TaxID=562 RepID=UPI00201D1C2C|nr:hypothetical protein [Escherichia coli]